MIATPLSLVALPSFLKRKRRIGAFAIALILVSIVVNYTLKHGENGLRPNQVVDSFGSYSLPNGRDRIAISKTPEGNVRVTFFHPQRKYYFLKTFFPRTLMEFEAERDWFLSVDDYDRIWLFIGRWDPKWGELRTLPSGGTIPYRAAVLMDGSWFDGTGQILNGGMVVSATGDWTGVPSEFFDRIPSKDKSEWGMVRFIPASPPPFSEQQKLELISELKRRASR